MYQLAIQLNSADYREVKKKTPEVITLLSCADSGYYVDAATTHVGQVLYLWTWNDIRRTNHDLLQAELTALGLRLGFWSYDNAKMVPCAEIEEFRYNTFDVRLEDWGLEIDPDYSGNDPLFDEVEPEDIGTYKRGGFDPIEGVGSWL